MGAIFDFFGSAAGTEILRITDSLLTIVAAVVSGAALRNTVQMKKAIGGTLQRGVVASVRDLFRRGGRRSADRSATVAPDPSTLLGKIEGLKTTVERMWIQQGLRNRDTDERLDRIDPPTRRH